MGAIYLNFQRLNCPRVKSVLWGNTCDGVDKVCGKHAIKQFIQLNNHFPHLDNGLAYFLKYMNISLPHHRLKRNVYFPKWKVETGCALILSEPIPSFWRLLSTEWTFRSGSTSNNPQHLVPFKVEFAIRHFRMCLPLFVSDVSVLHYVCSQNNLVFLSLLIRNWQRTKAEGRLFRAHTDQGK